MSKLLIACLLIDLLVASLMSKLLVVLLLASLLRRLLTVSLLSLLLIASLLVELTTKICALGLSIIKSLLKHLIRNLHGCYFQLQVNIHLVL